MGTPTRTTYQFGPFEVNAASGELLKQGKRVRLQEQPFRLLLILLENAGEVVSRTEIQRAIWDENTFVDFDSSLRVAVRKLRDALEDDAEHPHYIETIPKRGYRFLGPAHPAHPAKTDEDGRGVGAVAPEAAPGIARASPWRSSKWVLVAVLLVLAAAAIGTFRSFIHSHRAQALTEKDSVLIGDFANSTGDPVFDGTLRQGLSIQLEQSPFLSIVSDEQIQQTLQMMGQKPDVKLNAPLMREICQRTVSAAFLEGSIAQIGTRYLLTLKAVNCVSGESLASTEAQARDKNDVLDALGKTASDIRTKLGESLSTVEKFDTHLVQATTPSLEALKAFSAGIKVATTTGSVEAIPLFKRAIELDPNFALAYAWLGRTYEENGELGIAANYTRKAYELRDRVSDAEKYYISFSFDKVVRGNMASAEQTCKLWTQAFPRSEMPHAFLMGAIYPVTGQYEKAVEEGRAAIRLNPDFPIPYALLMFNLTALNRLDEAKATYGQALKRNLNHGFFHLALYAIAFLENDAAGMRHQVLWSAAKPGVEDELLDLEADTAGYFGRLRSAREFSRGAMDSAERAQEKETAATYLAEGGLREALFGSAEEARRRVSVAMTQTAGRDAQYFAALALAFAGEDRRGQALTESLGKAFPEDTIVQFNYLPTLRAKLSINRGNAAEALESLNAAAPYELGASTSGPYNWAALYPVFVRGEAELAAHEGGRAAAEFQKIIDRRGIVLNEPIGALAHLQLGRAYAMQGDALKARVAYQDFLALWKDGDADIPILKQAKREYAKLH